MKKNIVLLIPQLKFGGAERVVSRLSFALREKYNLMIVVFDGENVTYEIGCTLKSLDIPPTLKGNIFMKTINVFRRILEYRKFKRDNNIDLTYSFGDTANIVNVFSFGKDKKISSVRGFKRIRTNDGFLNRYIKKPISKNVLAKSDKVISVSELITKTIVQEYKIDEKKVETIYNGYESNEIILKSQENLSNEEHKTFSEEKILISAGTFRSEKGYWHLLKAFSLVLKKEKNAKLVILGRDYNNNKQKIEELAQNLNISDSIIYLGYQNNPFKYFSKSALYILSSTFEGFPNSLVEAMQCGLPVIASDCKSGPREILSPETDILSETEEVEFATYGTLVKRMNVIENYNHKNIEDCDKFLAKGILTLLGDPKLRSHYSSQSIKRAKDFSIATWEEKHNQIIDILFDK